MHEKSALSYRRTQRDAARKEPIRCHRDCCGMHKKPNVVGQMTFDAYEPEAFSPNLTKAEAARRIDMLQAKLKLMSEPPHTQ